MDSEVCMNCGKFKWLFFVNEHEGKLYSYEQGYLMAACDRGNHYRTLATVPVGGKCAFRKDMVFDGTESTYVKEKDLQPEQLEDLDNAKEMAFRRIETYGINEIPKDCDYLFEMEICEMNRDFE